VDSSDEVVALLREIRDTQREHLDEYRRFAAESIGGQRSALAKQAQAVRLYRVALVVGGVVLLIALAFLAFLAFVPR